MEDSVKERFSLADAVWRHLIFLVLTICSSSSWEPNRFSPCPEITHFYAALTVHYRIQIFLCLPLLCKSSIQYLTPFRFLIIHFNIIHSAKRGSPKCPLYLSITKQKTVSINTLSHTCYMKRPINYYIWSPEQWMKDIYYYALHYVVSSTQLLPRSS